MVTELLVCPLACLIDTSVLIFKLVPVLDSLSLAFLRVIVSFRTAIFDWTASKVTISLSGLSFHFIHSVFDLLP